MTIAQQMAYVPGTLAGTTASTDSTVYGALYQWGRWTDGHQMRNSATVNGPLSGANLAANGQVTGANAPKFVTNTVGSPWDWRNPQLNTLWGATKTAGDPCPPGWRVPTQSELNSIATSPLNNWTWNNSGTQGYAVTPAEGTWVTLFLPAGGQRSSYSAGGIAGAGTAGVYAASTPYGTDYYCLSVKSGAAAVVAWLNRGYGSSVRCVLDN